MTTVELLKAARKRIEDPARWTRGATARDAKGADVPSESERAVCWCAYGAVLCEAGGSRPVEYAACTLLDKCAPVPYGLVTTNDRTDHATVLKMFDGAIAIAEATA